MKMKRLSNEKMRRSLKLNENMSVGNRNTAEKPVKEPVRWPASQSRSKAKIKKTLIKREWPRTAASSNYWVIRFSRSDPTGEGWNRQRSGNRDWLLHLLVRSRCWERSVESGSFWHPWYRLDICLFQGNILDGSQSIRIIWQKTTITATTCKTRRTTLSGLFVRAGR